MRKHQKPAVQVAQNEPAPAPPAPPPAEAAPAQPTAPTATPPPSGNDQLTEEQMKKIMEEEEKKTEVITIHETGSLIERQELTTPAPITVMKRSDIQSTGLTNTGDVLQKLPSQGGAANSNVNNGGDGSTRVSLRNLGADRTLVLLNGRRIVNQGTGADQSVDINSIPIAVIERVEVLKDGASAIYGSDAIGGVVNIITRTDFEGTEVNLQAGTSMHGDGQTYDVAVTTGTSGKKGSAFLSVGYTSQNAVMAGDRDFSAFDISDSQGGWDWKKGALSGKHGGSSYIPGGFLVLPTDPNGVNIEPTDPTKKSAYDTDIAANCPSQVCTVDQTTGKWRDYKSSTDKYNYQTREYLYIPLERFTAFGQGNYKLDPKVNVFVEGSAMDRTSSQQLAPVRPTINTDASTPTVISKNSVYNPYGLDFGDSATGSDYRRRFLEFSNRDYFQEVASMRFVAGLNGSLPENDILKDWKWELSGNYGRTNSTGNVKGDVIQSHLAKALGPSFKDDKGVYHCGTDIDHTLDAEGCVPLALLQGAAKQQVTPDMIHYVTFTSLSTGFDEQQTLLGTLTGPLFKLPHGVVSLAVGGDYRHEEGQYTPDPLTALGDTSGNLISPASGDFHVAEGFAELEIVPISGVEWARWLEFDFAARAYDYNTFGSGVTWKAGGLFRTEGGFSIRGTYSSAFRAPGISDLYLGGGQSNPAVLDPCDLSRGGAYEDISKAPPLDPTVAEQCKKEGIPADFAPALSQQTETVGGNPKLKAETANSYTFGAVWEPPMIGGLSLTLDYFNISIDDAIQAYGSPLILNLCYTKPTHQLCDLIRRGPTSHVILDINDRLLNVGTFETSGIDFAAAYDFKNATIGEMRLSVVGTYLLVYNDTILGQKFEGAGVYDLGANPNLKMNFGIAWGKSGWNAGANVRFISSFDECQNDDCSAEGMNLRRSVDTYVTADLFAGYTFKTDTLGTTQIAVGMNNITDTTPPYVANVLEANSDDSLYDYLGRMFYMRLTQKF
jgi:outer membrane receptor protein involved in Fe transport